MTVFWITLAIGAALLLAKPLIFRALDRIRRHG